MADFDVAVIGGGPAGHAAALAASRAGASVALVEADEPGGACIHHSCIPTAAMLQAATTHISARELSVVGVFEAGDRFNLAHAAARKDAMVKHLAQGVRASLRMAKVEVIAGRGALRSRTEVEVGLTEGGSRTFSADAIVIATGTRWETPAIPGVAATRILTVDMVQALPVAPASAVVLGGGPADTAFALEYAVLLAVAGSEVAYVTRAGQFLPALDRDVAAIAHESLADLGIAVHQGATVESGDATGVVIRSTQEANVPAEVIVAADPRLPLLKGLGLEAAGVLAKDHIAIDRGCRTNVTGIFAAGDVTGGPMLSSAAMHMGEVAGRNAAGDNAATRLSVVPHVLHTVPEIGWVGLTEEQARTAGYAVRAGAVDLSYNAHAVTHGFQRGGIKVIADARLGQVLGVHGCGPGVSEAIAVAAAMMQAEASIEDIAAMVQWHPSAAEALVEAARRALN